MDKESRMSQRWERQKVLSIKTVIGFNSTEYIYKYNFFYQLDINVYWVINSHLKFCSHSFHNMNWKTFYKKAYMFTMDISI